MAARWTAALAMLAVIGAAGAESSGKTVKEALVEQLELFQLCTMEARMDLLVNDLPDHAARAGLTREGIRDVIESRLRRARIYDPNADPLLQSLVVLGEPEEGHIPFYSIELAYLRELLAERLGLSALAETWSTGGSGQGDAGSFLEHLSGFVDAFVAAYLGVRDSAACRELRKRGASNAGRPSKG